MEPGRSVTVAGRVAFTADAIDGDALPLRHIPPTAYPYPHIYTVAFSRADNGLYAQRRSGRHARSQRVARRGRLLRPVFDDADADIGCWPAEQLSLPERAGGADVGSRKQRRSGKFDTVRRSAFSNTGPTGTADDITLATGSLVSGIHFGSPPDIRSIGDFVQTFQPAAGEGGFFVTPVSPHDIRLIEEILTTPPPAVYEMVIADPNDPPLRSPHAKRRVDGR